MKLKNISLWMLTSGRWWSQVLIPTVGQDIPRGAGRDVTIELEKISGCVCGGNGRNKQKHMASHLGRWTGILLWVLASGRWWLRVLIPTVGQDIPGRAGRDITI